MPDEPVPGQFRPPPIDVNFQIPHIEVSDLKELQPTKNEDLVAQYRLFQIFTKAKCNRVYHPCGETDMSPSVAFPGATVTYVDLNEKAITALQKAELNAHTTDALTFNPGQVDVLIMLNPQILVDVPSQHVVPGGYVLCNDYHGTASRLRTIPGWELKGVIVPTREKNYRFDVDGLEKYWEEVETDEEWKQARFDWGSVLYKSAAELVEVVTGKKENVLAEFKKILKTERESTREKKIKQIEEHPEYRDFIHSEIDDDILVLTVSGRQFIVNSTLPKKKGTVDDLFVFQKSSILPGTPTKS